MNFRLFFTNLLLRLLKIPFKRIDEKRVRTFLWTALPQQGFQDYIAKRDMSILQQLGMGVQREEYLTLLGQRIEVGILLSQAKIAYEKVEKDRQEKIEAIKNTFKERTIIKK